MSLQEAQEAREEDDEDAIPEIQIRRQNIVATVHFNCALDLTKIAQTVRNAEYNPTRFQATIMRIRDPRTTALIFASGKVIITGAKTENDSRTAGMKFKEIISRVGYNVHFNDYKVQNITATFDAGFPVRLEGFIFAHASQSTYEPELFPGLVYRMTEPKVVLLIFVSGKVVITGAKSDEVLGQALGHIYPLLLEFRKKNIVITTGS